MDPPRPGKEGAMELWGPFDGERRPLYRARERGKPLAPGEYHALVSVWTLDSRKNMLPTLRDPCKDPRFL